MAVYGVTIKDAARPKLRRLVRAIEDGEYLEAAGAAGENTLKEHFRRKNLDGGTHTTASRLGARPSQVFADFAEATWSSIRFQGVDLVVSDHRVNQFVNGGDIVPTGGRRYLTLPATAAAYGVRAREAGVALVFAFSLDERSRWRPSLVAAENYEREIAKGKNAGAVVRAKGNQKATRGVGKVWYWLARRVRQQPRPDTIPGTEALRADINQALADWQRSFTQ